MKKATKTLYMPATRTMRKWLHDLDHKPRQKYLFDLSKAMERDVPKPSMVKIGGKMVRYTGP